MEQSESKTVAGASFRCLNCLLSTPNSFKCVHCGSHPQKVVWEYPHLKPGTLLHGRYIIGRTLGQGGFAITYLGLQEGLNRRVAIKEYYPAELADREESTHTVQVRRSLGNATDNQEFYRHGLDRFLEEGRNIVQCHQPRPHPNLVQVTDYFEENGTAYLVMDYVEGVSLEEFLKSQPSGRLDEREALAIIMPLLDGLGMVHTRGFMHRDVKPANVYISKDNEIILLDFGAARQSFGRERNTLTVMLTPGYAPPEQYTESGDQGPWSDVYGAAATLYKALTAETPPSAMARLSGTVLPAPNSFAEVRINGRLNRAVMAGLALDRKERIQSASAFKDALQRPNKINQILVTTHLAQKESGGRVNFGKLRRLSMVVFMALAISAAGIGLWQAVDAMLAKKGGRQETRVSEQQANELYNATRQFFEAMNARWARGGGGDRPSAEAAGIKAAAVMEGVDRKSLDESKQADWEAAAALYEQGGDYYAEGSFDKAREQYLLSIKAFESLKGVSDVQSMLPKERLAAAEAASRDLRKAAFRAGARRLAPAKFDEGEHMLAQAAGEADTDAAIKAHETASTLFQEALEEAQANKRAGAGQSGGVLSPSTVQAVPPGLGGGGGRWELSLGAGLPLVMAWIPGGEFMMGSDPGEAEHKINEAPRHRVVLSKGFWMGKCEVTVGQFSQFVRETGYRTAAEVTGGAWMVNKAGKNEWVKKMNWMNPKFIQDDNDPVVLVDHGDAEAFCKWLGEKTGAAFRLPSEAEWEYACRAGSVTAYQWGDDPADGETWLNGADLNMQRKRPNWQVFPFDDGHLYTAAVGTFQENAWGLQDMHGNVWEWCMDWYSPDFYSRSPEADPVNGEGGRVKVVRGGSWLWYPGSCRSAARASFAPDYAADDIGFRVVCTTTAQ